jgi:hypothetical protein
MRDRLKWTMVAVTLACAAACLQPALAVADGSRAGEAAEPALPSRTQSVVEQLTASRSESLNAGIVAGAGSLAPHCETQDDDTVQSATVAGNIMCIISRSPRQPDGAEAAPRTFGEALEGILTGPH